MVRTTAGISCPIGVGKGRQCRTGLDADPLKTPVRLALFDDDLLRRSAFATALQVTGRYHLVVQDGVCPETAQTVAGFDLNGALLMISGITESLRNVAAALCRKTTPCPIVVYATTQMAQDEVQQLLMAGVHNVDWRPARCVGPSCDCIRLIRKLNSLFLPGCALKLGKTGASRLQEAIDTLSFREQQVFQRIGQGNSYQDIAQQLSISRKSVETYAARIRLKLDLETGRQLFLVAAKHAKRLY